jgi:enoyl-CoA hydratase
MMVYKKYRYMKAERDGKVLKLSFNRPECMNSINNELHAEMASIFADVSYDKETFAVLLTGEGGAFSAGGDLKGMVIDNGGWTQIAWEAKKIINDLLDLEKPIIAAINGAAAGLGATVALFCDVIFASDRAKISDPHVKIGITAGDGGAVIWPLLCGVARAKEMLLTGDVLSADQAYKLGLVNHVVPHNELMNTAMAFAQRMANGPAYAIRSTKVSVNKLLKTVTNLTLDTSLALEGLSFQTEDFREGVSAFIEKREPKFKGR